MRVLFLQFIINRNLYSYQQLSSIYTKKNCQCVINNTMKLLMQSTSNNHPLLFDCFLSNYKTFWSPAKHDSINLMSAVNPPSFNWLTLSVSIFLSKCKMEDIQEEPPTYILLALDIKFTNL